MAKQKLWNNTWACAEVMCRNPVALLGKHCRIHTKAIGVTRKVLCFHCRNGDPFLVQEPWRHQSERGTVLCTAYHELEGAAPIIAEAIDAAVNEAMVRVRICKQCSGLGFQHAPWGEGAKLHMPSLYQFAPCDKCHECTYCGPNSHPALRPGLVMKDP